MEKIPKKEYTTEFTGLSKLKNQLQLPTESHVQLYNKIY